jgi:hypothetical protein
VLWELARSSAVLWALELKKKHNVAAKSSVFMRKNLAKNSHLQVK